MEIVINNLSKNYGKKSALKCIPFYPFLECTGCKRNEFFEKNKSDENFGNAPVPSSGEISMNGIPIKETTKIREIVGYLPQDFSFYRNMSVYGAMDYLGLLSNIPDKSSKKKNIGIA